MPRRSLHPHFEIRPYQVRHFLTSQVLSKRYEAVCPVTHWEVVCGSTKKDLLRKLQSVQGRACERCGWFRARENPNPHERRR